MTALFVGFALFVLGQEPTAIPTDSGLVTLDIEGTPIRVFTYKPKAYDGGPLIVVLHGTGRNADEYRDDARAMGDRFGALIAAPEFDAKRFPGLKYHQGGVLDKDRKVTPEREWTGAYIPKIVDQIRAREGRPDLPFRMIGHSAGGQFVARTAAFVDTGATRLVIANPSSQVYPSRDPRFSYPYGFGGLPESLSNDDRLRRYLGLPITIYLGTADDERDELLDDSPEADQQGQTRLRRGIATFREARRLAHEHGWPFRWRLVQAVGVGHDHTGMFNNPSCAQALFGPDGKPGTSDD